MAKNIARYEEQKEKKEVPLNRDKFLAQRAELNADKEEENEYDKLEAKHPVFKRDFYNNEVLAITLDYLQHSKVKELALSN